ncbi:tRNA (adenosine(37)-N6)-dimethylallyltransferase MiaA [Intestinibacillus massiliensis]|nr:tRNA (adenosine(37)-N6)-dimethylallyltransferase MiaA [Intestinibacillus massiliensis]
MQNPNQLICIAGPTASGKTALSVALARQRGTEIISADSMQIYRGMDIGTAKPAMEERGGVPHHLIDVADPGEHFSVARYVELADACAQALLARGKVPVVAGGTGLYMDALIECSTFSGDEADTAARRKYEALAAERGTEYVHGLLRQVDPESAARLHPNNLKRVIRALEVYEQTGMTIGALNARNKRPSPKYHAVMLGVCPASRETLYSRINRRVDQMVADGLLEETRALYEAGQLAGTAGQAIGYKELVSYLEGRDSLEDCIEVLKRRTRNYAKRQMTWLKKDDRIHWIYYNEDTEFSRVLQEATEYLSAQGL